MRFLTAFKRRFQSRKGLLMALVGVVLVSLGLPLLASAAGSADFSTIQTTLRDSEHHTIGMVGSVSIMGGITFFIASIFKFHRWRQNPQQISVGQGAFLLAIGIAMISLPITMSTANRAVMGQNEKISKLGDSRLANIVAPPTLDEEG
jgi:drug/metabolite transporter (DMT)-like permease